MKPAEGSERAAGRDGDVRDLLGDLSRIDRAPDVAPDVMHRLGYRRATARARARDRRRRLRWKAAFLMLVVAVIGAGIFVESRRPDLRTSNEATLVEAVQRDLQRTEDELLGSVRLLRGLVAPPSSAGPTADLSPGSLLAVRGGFAEEAEESGADIQLSVEGSVGAPGPLMRSGVEDRDRTDPTGLRRGGGSISEWQQPAGRGGEAHPTPSVPLIDLIERSGLGPVAKRNEPVGRPDGVRSALRLTC